MIKDTKKRIEAYKAMLPGVKERIAAVALMLVVSMVMMATASYAWLTISRAPEAKGMSTTITGNGNLEIALVPADGSLPGDSQGITSNLLESNITWGNLVNLSDSRYGLDQIVLRPATISGVTPTRTPLQGATYGEDGRVLSTTDLYRYASYVLKDDGKMYFSADDADASYGVRAITSVAYQNISGNAYVTVLQAEALQAYNDARAKYIALVRNETLVSSEAEIANGHDPVYSISALQELMQLYVQQQADEATNGSSSIEYSGQVTHAYNLISEFFKVMQEEGKMLLKLANLQIYLSGADHSYGSVDALVAAQNNNQLHSAVILDGLKQFAEDYAALENVLKDDPNKTDDFYDLSVLCDPGVSGTKPTVSWAVIQPAVSLLVDIDSATMDGMEIGTLAQQSKTTLIGIIMNSSTKEVIIYGGALREAEVRIGAHLKDQVVKVKVAVSAYGVGPFNVTAQVITDVSTGIIDTQDMRDYNYTLTLDNNTNSGEAVAKDTYGMAIDLWVRTNVSDVVLTLEGSLVTSEVTVTTYDKNGKEADVYIMATTTTTETNVYRVQNGSEYTYYNAETHEELGTSETMTTMAGYSFKASGSKGQNAAGEEVDLYIMTYTSTTRMDVYMIEGAKTWYNANTHEEMGTNETLTEDAGYTIVRTGKTGTDASGQQVELYTLTFVDPTTEKVTETTVYKVYANAEKPDMWYYDGSHIEIGSDEDMRQSGATFTEKKEEIVTGYDGVNRVWEDFLDLIASGKMAEDNTTQGSGSCYVFYADPSDQTRILELLKAFTVVFVDQDGKELGVAKLDTEHAFSINGKTTVPLMMVTGTRYTDENGEELTGITSLVRNEATRISAIVYLDGQYVSNEDVLAVGELEGMLNIQFGSSVTLQNQDDTDLRFQTREIYASATCTFTNDKGEQVTLSTDNSASPIELDYNGEKTKVVVTLTVTGEQPKTINGFFIRSISQFQGTRGETISFDYQGGNVWTATFELNRPGSYVMRNLIVDGTDYSLDDGTSQTSGGGSNTEKSSDNFPTINIAGLNIGGIYCSLNEGITMTADNYVDATISVSINASADLLPKQVRALFRSTDGEEFTALLSMQGDDGNNSTWVGNARIDNSGTYMLEYVVVDGDYYPTKQENAYIIYLGLKARVESLGIPLDEGGYSYEIPFKGVEKSIAVDVTIFDNTNAPLQGLEDTWLFYRSASSDLIELGMSCKLTWDNEKKAYTGVLPLKRAGEYLFDSVSVGSSKINQVRSAPTFKAYVTDPPVYVGHTTVSTQFVPNGGAQMQVLMINAETAYIWAEIQDQKGNTYMVRSYHNENLLREDGAHVFYFDIPANATGEYQGKQDGQWTLVALYMQEVAKPTGDPDNPLTWIASTVDPETQVPNKSDCYEMILTAENITSCVIQTVKVTISDSEGSPYTGEIFGLDGEKVNGKFMETFTSKDVVLTIQDWRGLPIEGLEKVKWNRYHEKNTNLTFGGYSAAVDLTFGDGVTLSGSGTTYTMTGQDFQWAGVYTSQFSITVGGATTTITGPRFEVHTNAPTVKITTADPGNGTAITDSNKKSQTQSVSDYAATVYMKYTEGETMSGCNTVPTYTYTSSSVSIELGSMGATVTSAKVTFAETTNGVVHLYSTANNSGTRTDTFSWTGNGTCTLFVGLGSATLTTDGGCTLANTLTATTLVIEYNGVRFTVDIPDLTISNPS